MCRLRRQRWLSTALLAVALLGPLVNSASAATYYVRTDGNNANSGTGSDAANAWASINYAMNRSLVPGDVVYVMPGTYVEHISPNVDGVSGNPIRLIGDKHGTVPGWEAGQVRVQATPRYYALYLNTDDYIFISGFKLVGSTHTAAYLHTAKGIRLEDCDMQSPNASGLYIYNSTVTLVNLLIHDCASLGLYSYGDSVTDAWNCTLVNNLYDGARSNNTSVLTITNSIIAYNGSYGLHQRDNSTLNHSYNVLHSNYPTNFRDTEPGVGEIDADPRFFTSNDWHLQPGSPAIDAGTPAAGIADDDLDGVARPQNSNWDMGCYESSGSNVYYVRPDGSDSNAGTGSSADEAWASVTHAASQTEPGDTVYVMAGTYVGGVEVSQNGAAGNPIVYRADRYGTVDGWSHGEVILQADAPEKCLYIDSADYVEFHGFTLRGNVSQSVVDINTSRGVVLSQCKVTKGDRGVVFQGKTIAKLLNCLIHGNSNQGVRVEDGDAQIQHCTIADNESDGVAADGGSTTVTNCILANNGEAGLDRNGGSLTHTYNLVFGNAVDYEGTSPSTGEVSADPQFMAAGDFQLMPSSPAKDSGTSSVGALYDDLAGKPRPHGAGWDMGCYESGNSYYVRNDGSDSNTGTGPDTGDAWATLAHAVSQQLAPGDTVFVKAGTYNERLYLAVDGALGSPIRFIGDRDGKVTDWDAGEVRVVAPSARRALYITGGSYLELSGFHFVGSNREAILLYPSKGIRLERCDVTSTEGTGITCYRTEVELVNLSIHDCGYIGLYSHNNSIAKAWNCTIISNARYGVYNTSASEMTLMNSIVAHNGMYGLHRANGIFNHSYNVIYGNKVRNYSNTSPGTGENSEDPKVISNGDYRLGLGSSAIDAGLSLSGIVDGDIEGTARPIGGAWDIGCYEMTGAHWRLDESSGSVAADSGPMGLDGTYSNGPILDMAAAYPGNVNTAVRLDGADDLVDLPDVDFDFSKGFSVSCWVKPTAIPASGDSFTFLNLSNGQEIDQVWVGWVGGTEGFQLSMTDTVDGGSLKTIEDNTPLRKNEWTHCVVSVDAGGTATLYRDGLVVKTGVHVSLPTNVSRSEVAIGNSPGSDAFHGSIDDVRLLPRPVSDEEVAELYGLVGHWKLDETSGQVAFDSSGVASHGTYVDSPNLGTSGIYGSTAEFDGISQFASIPGSKSTNVAEAVTVGCWVKSNTEEWSAYACLVSKRYQFMLYPQPGYLKRLRFIVYRDVLGWQAININLSAIDNFDIRDWHHYLGEYDHRSGTFSLYIDNELVTSIVAQYPIAGDSGPIAIGSDEGVANRFFDGQIDDVQLYNRLLSKSERSRLVGLMAHWKLNETAGSVATDFTESGHEATLAGNPVWTTKGAHDGALDFDESDGADSAGAAPFEVYGNQLSLIAWVRPKYGINERSIVMKSSGSSLAQQYWGLAVKDSQELSFRVKAGGTTEAVTQTNALRIGNWSQVVGTYDGSTLRMYVNSVEVGSFAHSLGGDLSTAETAPVAIGTTTSTSSPFDLRVDDVRVLNRVLSLEEITRLYRQGRRPGARIMKWVEAR